MMRQYLLLLALTWLAAGCAVGPSYHPEEVVPAKTQVGTAGSTPSVSTAICRLRPLTFLPAS